MVRGSGLFLNAGMLLSPSVNPSVSLVRIRSEKSLICLQSPQGFIGE